MVCMWMLCLHACLCTTCMSTAQEGQTGAVNPLGLVYWWLLMGLQGIKPGFSRGAASALYPLSHLSYSRDLNHKLGHVMYA